MSELTHTDPTGAARMVDVSSKTPSLRTARASGAITMAEQTVEMVRANALKKGDVLAVARVAGVMAAKRTSELIPLCHPLALTDVQVDLTIDESLPGVQAEATVRTVAPTGVEMEALVAVSVALLTVYDMVKGVDRSMRIGEIRVVEKSK
jgi:cyclic pyranopterin monophosphate synthase